MNLRTLYLVLHTDRPVKEEGTQLRGYIGRAFPEYPILHHHADVPIMTYPRVQYKIIGGTPSLLGIEEGADVLRSIAADIDQFTLLGSRYIVENRVIHEQITPFGPVKDPVHYRFHTPWVALNAKNYGAYRALGDWKERKEFLNRILVGNILSMAKGLGMVVDRRLYVHSRVDEERIRFKGVEMTGFTGEFRVNFAIPEYMGVGKGTSQGFGTVRALRRESPGSLVAASKKGN